MPITLTCMLPHPPLIVPAVGKGEESKIQQIIDAYNETARRIVDSIPKTTVQAKGYPSNGKYAKMITILL